MNATECGVLDWIRLRVGLADGRRAKALEVAQLAKAVGVSITTIYRIENVKEHPNHKPDLETIAAWAEATGLTLSSVFAKSESRTGLQNSTLQTPHKALDNRGTPQEQASHGGRAVSPADLAAVVGYTLIQAGSDILAAGTGSTPAQSHRPIPIPRAAKHPRRTRRTGNR
jgi:transcriptional regulator with XRE-family HTH domain